MINIKKIKKSIILTIVGAVIVLGILAYYLIANNSRKTTPQAGDQSVANTTEESSGDASKDDSNIANAAKDIQNQDYSAAVDHLNSAISENPYEPDYYSLKSEAQYQEGDKAGALATVQEGLKYNPDNEILRSKQDVLEKDSFNTITSGDARQ